MYVEQFEPLQNPDVEHELVPLPAASARSITNKFAISHK